MPFLTTDQILETNPLYIIMLMVSSVGIFDISKEITDDNREIFSKNFMKKLILFSFMYMKTKSISASSMVSIVVFFLFQKVFFGKTTFP